MSHFAVLVIRDSVSESLEEVLQPWHEYECTGVDDKYVVNVDITEEAKKEWLKYGEAYDDFLAMARADGYDVHGDRVFRRTNPTPRWDWWVIGGRYANRLHNGKGPCDWCFKGNLDFDAMRRQREQALTDTYRAAEETLAEMKANNNDQFPLDLIYGVDPREKTIEEFTANVPALSVWAVVYKGEWYEKGKMGWWGISTENKDEDEWEEQFNKLIDSLPDHAVLTMVDCHI